MATGMVRRVFLAAALASCLSWWSVEAAAAPPAPEERAEARPAGKVRVDAMDVYANQSGKVDPRLRELERQLLGLNFTGFQLLGTHADTVGANQTATFQVEGERKVEVTLLDRTAEDARIQIEVFKDGEKKADTTITLKRGRYFITRLGKHEEGSLLFAVSVSE
jgi:hypothetical protein